MLWPRPFDIPIHRLKAYLGLGMMGLPLVALTWQNSFFGCSYFVFLLVVWLMEGALGRILARMSPGHERWISPAAKAYLVIGGLLFAGLCGEIAILLLDPFLPLESRLILPKEWQRQPLKNRDYRWMGHPHRFNALGFRGKDYPPKDPRVFRIAVLGDSLTYGYGIAEQDTYSALLQQRLSRHFRVEVLNLGVSGYQSQQIVDIARWSVRYLRPDFILYGMCLNDFLPANVSDYQKRRWLELPASLASHTAVGLWLAKLWQGLLMRLGLEDDFFADILEGVDQRSQRFERDMQELNRTVRSAGLPPVLALVLSQFPAHRQAGPMIALAERRMRAAGLRVIPSSPYNWEQAYKRTRLHVSRWEGHPNEVANKIFADYFLAGIYQDLSLRDQLNRYRWEPVKKRVGP